MLYFKSVSSEITHKSLAMTSHSNGINYHCQSVILRFSNICHTPGNEGASSTKYGDNKYHFANVSWLYSYVAHMWNCLTEKAAHKPTSH